MFRQDIKKLGLLQVGLSVLWVTLFTLFSLGEERRLVMFAMVIIFLSISASTGWTLLFVYFYYGEKSANKADDNTATSGSSGPPNE